MPMLTQKLVIDFFFADADADADNDDWLNNFQTNSKQFKCVTVGNLALEKKIKKISFQSAVMIWKKIKFL